MSALEEMSRDDLIVLARAQQGQIARLAEQVSRVAELEEQSANAAARQYSSWTKRTCWATTSWSRSAY
ncbi:hypothetical protein ACTMTI_51480 [Nonomuraea sp. H19]|uniref:hypothetical protein n=1 Tax=Nonomuraea sp. H19 TaxID=3452206 RepID=UPI003F8AEC4C